MMKKKSMSAKAAVHAHEKAKHPGKPLTKFAKGGAKSPWRCDEMLMSVGPQHGPRPLPRGASDMMKAKKVPTPPTGGREPPSDLNVVIGQVGKPCPPMKTSGMKIRGTGAATKGTMARGPMA
jgi:hypothetical protein